MPTVQFSQSRTEVGQWSMTGIWPGLRCFTAASMTLIACLIITGELDDSVNSGSIAVYMVSDMPSCRLAWKAAREMPLSFVVR